MARTKIIKEENKGGTQIISGGTQVISGGTQVLGSGTQVLGGGNPSAGGTQILTGTEKPQPKKTARTRKTAHGSEEPVDEGGSDEADAISGWKVIKKIPVVSGEADLYIAEKDGKQGVIKYYHGNLHPKKELMDKLLGLDHPDIIKIYEYGEYNGHSYEIMEYAAGGSVDSRNEDGTYKYLPMKEKQVVGICKEVINSFKTCHEKGIIHRDIKPENLYFRNADGTDVVIGDFGISSLMEKDESVSHKTQTRSRTIGYAAAEVYGGLISPKMDYYALGITLWVLLTGKDPFVKEDGTRRADQFIKRDTIEGRMADDLLSQEPILSNSMQHLIRGLLVSDPETRWGYDEVSRHLNGEKVDIVYRFEVGDKTYGSLSEIGKEIGENPDAWTKTIYRGNLSGSLEDRFPDIVKKIDAVIDETSAGKNYEKGLRRIAWILNPNLPYKIRNGYSAKDSDDLAKLILDAPETMSEEILDEKSEFFDYLEICDQTEKVPEIRKLMECMKVAETRYDFMNMLYQIAVILKDYEIKPFEQEEYRNLVLKETSDLNNIPEELQDYVIYMVKTKELKNLLIPWMCVKNPAVNPEKITSWTKLTSSL